MLVLLIALYVSNKQTLLLFIYYYYYNKQAISVNVSKFAETAKCH